MQGFRCSKCGEWVSDDPPPLQVLTAAQVGDFENLRVMAVGHGERIHLMASMTTGRTCRQ